MRRLPLLLLLVATPLAAQTSPALRNAAGTITEADVARRIRVIADDSMMGRQTPSPGLELTAQYVAGEFKRFGLRPGGDSGGYIQRYPLTTYRIDVANSAALFRSPEIEVPVSFSRDAVVLFGNAPAAPITGGLTLIGGVIDPDSLPADLLKDRIVVWPLDFTKPIPAWANSVLGRVFASGAKLLVVVSNRDSAAFNGQLADQARPKVAFGEVKAGGPLVVEIRESAVTALVPDAIEQFTRMRAAPATVIQPVPDWEGDLAIRQEVVGVTMVPNTVGILEGSDPVLKNEYVVFSAHMDHIGISSGKPDSINNGADDDGSGTVGVIELAEAFSRPGARPRRSVLFLTVSGEEHGLWGSAWFADHPAVPIERIVADLNIDMIGRNWKDTVVAIGMQHSDLGTTLARVAAEHPELDMTPVDDMWPEENLYFRSDHYNFAKKGVPILFFTSGLHEDYHKPSDEPQKLDAEKEARLLRLLFYLGQEVAGSPARPQWKPESYKKIVEGA